ncbi:MAG: FISUMP domain-containing protein [Fibrobacteraceae bacterium]
MNKLIFLFFSFAVLFFVACIGDGDDASSEQIKESSSSETFAYSSSSFSAFSKGEFLNSSLEYGTLEDSRDGKIYKTVSIGNRLWMAENLNYADSLKAPVLIGKTKCVDSADEDCNTLGRYYHKSVIMQLDSNSLDSFSGVFYSMDYQGVCPDGWRIPSDSDWQNLVDFIKESDKDGDVLVDLMSSKLYVPKNLYSDKLLKLCDTYAHNDSMKTVLGLYCPDSSVGTNRFGFSALTMSAFYWSTAAADSDSCCFSNSTWTLNYAAKQFNKEIAPDFETDDGIIRCVQGGSVGKFYDKEDLLNSKVKYDSFVDERDGASYKTVEMNGKLWMAENLNYADGLSVCYQNDERLCAIAGRLYAAPSLRVADREICPDGWHLPSFEDWDALFIGNKVKSLFSISGWFLENKDADSANGTGFSIFPAGSLSDEDFFDFGEKVHFAYLDEQGSLSGIEAYPQMNYDLAGISEFTYSLEENNFVSVRCIKTTD